LTINPELEPDEHTELLRLAEAVLFAAVEPLDEASIGAQLPKAPKFRPCSTNCAGSMRAAV